MLNASAPNKKPTQSAEKLRFPAWRIANGVMNATDENLEISAISCERWTWGCGGLLLFGLLVEVLVAVIHPPYDSFAGTWASVIADSFVTIGVGGEIIFAFMGFRRQEELGKRAKLEVEKLNKLAAEANERAADALLELERLKAPRRLTELQANAVVAKLAPFRGRKTLVIASPATYEGALFADQINRILNEASLESTRLDRFSTTRGSSIAQDVHVTFSEEDSASEELVFAIVDAFVSVGVKADSSAASPDWWPAIKGHALVVVGDKT